MLKVGDINWETEELSIVQSKTGNPLKLPIRPAVGNAIYDYLSERKNLEPASPLFESIQLQGAPYLFQSCIQYCTFNA